MPNPPSGWKAAPLDPADFPGCKAIHIPPEEIEDYEGRLEYWESRTATAMVVSEPTTFFHEQPSQRLAGLARLIAASRGAPIETFGTADLVRFGARGRTFQLLQADQIVYLDPPPAGELKPRLDVDADDKPDVVLEVDYFTDVRGWKVPLYEAWGFPEVWVDVPEERSASRPKSRLPGLTIHVLEAGRFRQATSSRVFPGWTAKEIHTALNEPARSHGTVEALHRVGMALAAAEGTGPDDDPWLRRHRDESRAKGRAEGEAKGRTEGEAVGRTQARTASAIALLAERGISVTSAQRASLADLHDLGEAELMRAALRCASAADFLRRLERGDTDKR